MKQADYEKLIETQEELVVKFQGSLLAAESISPEGMAALSKGLETNVAVLRGLEERQDAL